MHALYPTAHQPPPKGDSVLRASRLVLIIALATAGCAATGPRPIVGCDASANAKPLCGFQNPEDLAPLPGGGALLVSEYGAMEGNKPGALSVLDLASEKRRVLFRGGDAVGAGSRGWGDDGCPGPPSQAFSPHGIDLARRPDGALQLAVVQHGGRESIEFFEVNSKVGRWSLKWRGCAIPPESAWLNEVVLLPDGSLYTSHMMTKGQGFESAAEGLQATGHVYHWSAHAGFRKVPGTGGAMVNGLEVSADASKLFLNVSGESQVRRIDLATGKVEAIAEVPTPDNSTWSPNGRLLVASLLPTSTEAFAECQALTHGACPIPYQIISLDPDSMQTEVIYRGGDAPMGAGTVGLQVGDELFMGSFAGDRVLRAPLPAAKR